MVATEPPHTVPNSSAHGLVNRSLATAASATAANGFGARASPARGAVTAGPACCQRGESDPFLLCYYPKTIAQAGPGTEIWFRSCDKLALEIPVAATR